jgi:hypothetical protein
LNCPHCGQSFEALEGQRFCSFCGGSLETPEDDKRAKVGEAIALDEQVASQSRNGFVVPTEPYVPWEDLDNLGFFRGLARTVRDSLFSPTEFFSRLPLHRGLLNPLLYALILQTVGNMAGYVSGLLVNNPLLPQARLTGTMMIALGLLIPVITVVWLALWAILLHVSLFLLGGANEDFEATFRIVAYVSAADLFNGVPLLGSLIAIIWKLCMLIPGVREVHRVTTTKAAAAVFLPLIGCCAVLVGGVSLAVLGAGGLLD